MPRPLLSLSLLLVLTWLSPAAAAPTPAQRCEGDVELASAKFAQCRLTAESKYSKAGDAGSRTAALARCSEKLQQSFAKAVGRYGLNCTNVPVAAFDAYLKQCSDDAAAAAGGSSLPDYVGDLASCSADLTTCDGGLTTCTGDLATCSGGLAICTTDLATAQSDVTTCEGDLAACQLATPQAKLLKTGQTTSYGAGTDGDLQFGVAQSYVDNGDGTITDTRTGLMWEKKSDDGSIHDKDNTYTWGLTSSPYTMNGSVVSTFLAGLNAGGGFAGHTDWRLPNRRELESIVNLENVNPAVSAVFNANCGVNSSGNPGCPVTACSCTVASRYWSSSTYAGNLAWQVAWYVFFGDGYSIADYKDIPYYVRAVRGGS